MVSRKRNQVVKPHNLQQQHSNLSLTSSSVKKRTPFEMAQDLSQQDSRIKCSCASKTSAAGTLPSPSRSGRERAMSVFHHLPGPYLKWDDSRSLERLLFRRGTIEASPSELGAPTAECGATCHALRFWLHRATFSS